MTATVTPHKVRVRHVRTWWAWLARCQADDCDWDSASLGPGAWQSAVGKALAHVDETKEEA